MKYKLMCLDLDGTLLNEKKHVTADTVKELRKLSEAGMEIALVTGRMVAATKLIREELQIPCILACSAGTYILKDGKCISSEYMSTRVMRELNSIARKYNIPLWIFREQKWYVTAFDEYVTYESGLIHYIPEIVDADTLANIWDEKGIGPNKLLFAAHAETLKKVSEELNERKIDDADKAYSAVNYLEIFPKGINKGTALHTVREKLGIAKEETVAFGDQELDIPLLQEAGFGVAMGNSIDELKQIADFVTKSNDEDGIAYAIRECKIET